MYKKSIAIVTILALAASFNFVSAKPGNQLEGFKLPDNASEVAQNVFSLGSVYDAQSDSMVEGYAIVHKRNDAKPSSNSSSSPKATSCYGYLAAGAKWKNLENWVFNPSNSFGLDQTTLFNTEAADIQKWENASGFNILGNGSMTTSTLVADETTTDGVNEVYFGALSDPNTIAVTIVWGVFSGPTFNRKLVEWDQVFNTNYNWSLSGEAGKMDFENISTHELGHAVGMADIYNSSCSTVTMYGYADFGQTNKRTLEVSDVVGIGTLY